MPRMPAERSNKVFGIIVIIIIVIAFAAGLRLWLKQDSERDTQKVPAKAHIPAKDRPVIDYNKIEKDKELKALMQKRKAQYGVEKGIDIITKSDESFRIGDTTIPMQEILDKIRLKSGDIVERDLKAKSVDSKEKIKAFGIYVVQAGDNIWNIHFNFLRDYFDHKGATLSPLADEPIRGKSSGVGKLLKFSENMVYIYNIKDRKLDVDINLITPLSKVVVYNMNQVFALLDLIDYEHVNRIQFDGETLWIPAKQ
jgi:hypothetical protein